MKVVKNDNPRWTWRHLEHYKKYRDAYGFGLTTAEFERESSLLLQGCPGRRYDFRTECYEIYAENGELAGEITLTLAEVPELGIVVFDQYRNRGYARKALAFLAAFWKGKHPVIEAVVKSDNPARVTVRDILESGGFIFKCKLPGGGLLFVLLPESI